MGRDRIFIDKAREHDIRKIKDNNYLVFDNQKDVFMYALAVGSQYYDNEEFTSSKEGFFSDRDLTPEDRAIIYSITSKYLDEMDDLIDIEKVLSKAECIANKGFSVILADMKSRGPESYLLDTMEVANELFEKAIEEKLFDD